MVLAGTKRFAIILSANLILFGIGIAILELMFGNWVTEDNLNKLNIIRDRAVPYYVKDLYDSPSETINYTRDKFGLRGKFEKPSEITILTVGGSTTDQRYIADGQTWQDILQENLKSIGKDIVIANAGVDGQSTFGHIKNFDWWFPYIPDLKPKYVLFYIGLNDFYKDEGYGFDALTVEKSIWQLLKERSAILHALRILYGVYQAEIEHKIGHSAVNLAKLEWVSEPLQNSYDKLMRTRIKELRERLEILIKRTTDLGSVPIFVTQPSRKYRYNNGRIEGVKTTLSYDGTPINGVDYFFMMKKIDGVTKSVCNNQNVICVDLAGKMTWMDEDFYDFSHMTPSGTRKVGSYLFKELKDKL